MSKAVRPQFDGNALPTFSATSNENGTSQGVATTTFRTCEPRNPYVQPVRLGGPLEC